MRRTGSRHFFRKLQKWFQGAFLVTTLAERGSIDVNLHQRLRLKRHRMVQH
jgi:hypothetical protein